MDKHLLEQSPELQGRPPAAFFITEQRLPIDLPPLGFMYQRSHPAVPETAPTPTCPDQLTFLPEQDFEFETISESKNLKTEIAEPDAAELHDNLDSYHILTNCKDKLSAEQQVKRQLALVNIKRTIMQMRPFAFDEQPQTVPTGVYAIGKHIYRCDRSGFYVVGQDPQGANTYKTLRAFQQPCSYSFAGEQAWVELADDVLSVSEITAQAGEPFQSNIATAAIAVPRQHIVEATLPHIEPEQAAANRERASMLRMANGAFAHAYCFWLTNQDLMPEEVGRVLQIYTLPSGELSTERADGGSSLTLEFDARQRNEHTFIWRLKSANLQTHSKTIDELVMSQTVSGFTRHAQITASRQPLNSQQQKEGVPSPLDSDTTFWRMFYLLNHDSTRAHIAELRQKLETAREDIGKFALLAVLNPQGKPYMQADPGDYTSTLDKKKNDFYLASFR